MFTADHAKFAWHYVSNLFGVPYGDPRVQDLFARAGLAQDRLTRESRLGIYSMPPHDKAPCPVSEIDLSPSFRVRIRFKHAALVQLPPASAQAAMPRGARPPAPPRPDTFVFSSITYFLEGTDEVEPFSASLPFGIQLGDDLKAVTVRVGAPPTNEVFKAGDDSGYAIWEDRVPVLHVLFTMGEKEAPLKVNVFLPPPASTR